MATTTNYGWTTPDDTALVKDGAAAIRTLGSSVDTTTKALNPSTTLGDIEYRSSTANTNTRLGIGSTGQVLTVAGGVPSWATPAGGFSGVSLKKSAAQTISNATDTAITFDQEDYDTNTYHDNSTNTTRITIPAGKGGYYSVQAMLTFVANSAGIRAGSVRINGTTNLVDFGCNNDGASSGTPLLIQKTISAVAGDYFELYVYKDGGGSLDIRSGVGLSYFTMSYLGA